MSEPEYYYVKGQGWVPTDTESKWCLIFRIDARDEWSNAQWKGHYCTKPEAEQMLADYLAEGRGNSMYKGWEWEIIPYDKDGRF